MTPANKPMKLTVAFGRPQLIGKAFGVAHGSCLAGNFAVTLDTSCTDLSILRSRV